MKNVVKSIGGKVKKTAIAGTLGLAGLVGMQGCETAQGSNLGAVLFNAAAQNHAAAGNLQTAMQAGMVSDFMALEGQRQAQAEAAGIIANGQGNYGGQNVVYVQAQPESKTDIQRKVIARDLFGDGMYIGKWIDSNENGLLEIGSDEFVKTSNFTQGDKAFLFFRTYAQPKPKKSVVARDTKLRIKDVNSGEVIYENVFTSINKGPSSFSKVFEFDAGSLGRDVSNLSIELYNVGDEKPYVVRDDIRFNKFGYKTETEVLKLGN